MNYLNANSFSVVPSGIKQTDVVFTFDYTTAVWASIKINFWASTNSHIQIGTFNLGILYSNPANVVSVNNVATAFAALAQPFPANSSPILRVFINGADFSGAALQISVAPTNLQNTQLTVRIQVGSATSLKRIWLSYLAFSPSTANFGSYGGILSQTNFQGILNSDISRTIYSSSYLFYGFMTMSISGSQPISFTSSIDSDFVYTIQSSRAFNSFDLCYIVIGVLPGSNCLCSETFSASGPNCIARNSCPAGTY